MLLRTHLAITILAVLLLISHVEHKILFVVVALIATLIPDIDSGVSTLGRKRYFAPIQFIINHRGILHSFTFLILATVVLALFLPLFALPFFLGYSLHLFADSFTIMGIKPFYPSHATSSGRIRTGGRIEKIIFTLFFLLDILVVFLKLFRTS